MVKLLALGAAVLLAVLLWLHFFGNPGSGSYLPENAFDSVRLGMKPVEVRRVLGEPNEITTGEIQQPQDPSVKTLASLLVARARGTRPLYIYQVNQDDSLWILFDNVVIAVSYYIEDVAVLYTGRDEMGARPTRVFGARLRDPQEAARLNDKVTDFLNRRALAAFGKQRAAARP